MENYKEFLLRIGEFQLPDMDLGKSYFKGKASLAYKIDENNRLKDFFGDTVVFELDDGTKEIIGGIIDEVYVVAPECFAERLRTDTLHMTLHDLSNSPKQEDVAENMERNLEDIKMRVSRFGKRIIKMKTSVIFNMVNTSLVIGLVPADENEYHKLMELYGIADEVIKAQYPLTPHITLGYYNVHGFDEKSARALEAAVGRINRREPIEITLDTERLYYQRFTSMNRYENVVCLGQQEMLSYSQHTYGHINGIKEKIYEKDFNTHISYILDNWHPDIL